MRIYLFQNNEFFSLKLVIKNFPSKKQENKINFVRIRIKYIGMETSKLAQFFFVPSNINISSIVTTIFLRATVNLETE